MLNIKESTDGVTFLVRVLPRSSRDEIVGVTEGALKVKLTAPPVEGAANKHLIEFIAKKLKVAKSRVEIVSGESSRNKTISVTGIKKEDLLTLYDPA